jgi:surface antigen
MIPIRTPLPRQPTTRKSGDKMKIQMAFLACLLAVAGCASTTSGQSALGAATGAVVSTISGGDPGSGKVAAAIVKEMRGGLVGGDIGSDLTPSERSAARQAAKSSLGETGSPAASAKWLQGHLTGSARRTVASMVIQSLSAARRRRRAEPPAAILTGVGLFCPDPNGQKMQGFVVNWPHAADIGSDMLRD